ncbi:MAG: hypothetical protein JST16_14475 [Bdellovibrionales bacterium]|nr:hypothetical protein [Bdellovibrionales bacterium]
MNFDLPGDSSRRHTIRWLKQLIRYVGLGFHLDTAPNDYILSEGRPLFTPAESAILEQSRDRLLEILGTEQPYEFGADITIPAESLSFGCRVTTEVGYPSRTQVVSAMQKRERNH